MKEISNKNALILIGIFVLCIFIVGVIMIYIPASTNVQNQQVSSELNFATQRVMNYWKENDPQSYKPEKLSEITKLVKDTSSYRSVSFDRAADLIILSLKTRDADVIEIMR